MKKSKEVVVVMGGADEAGMRTASVALQMSSISVGQAKRFKRSMLKQVGENYEDEFRHDGKYVVSLPLNPHEANDSRKKLLGIQNAVKEATGKVVPIDLTSFR